MHKVELAWKQLYVHLSAYRNGCGSTAGKTGLGQKKKYFSDTSPFMGMLNPIALLQFSPQERHLHHFVVKSRNMVHEV